MIEITEQEYLLFQKLKHILLHSYPDKFPDHYFICGEGGSKDEMGLPEIILVCPAYGVDTGFTKMYKRVGD